MMLTMDCRRERLPFHIESYLLLLRAGKTVDRNRMIVSSGRSWRSWGEDDEVEGA
jgi:hypothetical protein